MFFHNEIWLAVGKRRWLKKRLLPFIPEIGKFKIDSNFNLFLNLKDFRGPSFYIMYGGISAFEHYEWKEKQEILKYLPNDGVFVDIGANIGLFSYYIHRMRPHTKIYSFEPHPLLFRCLDQTRSENQIGNVTCFPIGLSDQAARLHLYLDETDSGGHSLSLGSFDSTKEKSPRSVEVEISTLDRIAEAGRWDRIDFIKMDVQELEDKVLLGSRSVIERFRPQFLIEFHNSLLQTEFLSPQHFPLKNYYQWKPIGLEHPLFEMDQLKSYSNRELEKGNLHTNYLFLRRT
jgi:FkbM family methyltransferase